MIESILLDPAKATLERQFPERQWHVPHKIDMKEGKILWDDTEVRDGQSWIASRNYIRSKEGFLDKFVELANNNNNEAILKYAKRWGVLRICRHGRPFSWGHSFRDKPCYWLGFEETGTGWEPVTAWKYYAQSAAAIIRIAENLHNNRKAALRDLLIMCRPIPTRLEDWPHILGWPDIPSSQLPKKYQRGLNFIEGFVKRIQTVETQRGELEMFLNDWLRKGEVGLEFSWKDRKAEMTIGGPGLFGALAVQLALAASNKESFYRCDGCKKVYSARERRPKQGQRNYCETCRKDGRPIRDAVRDHYIRTKGLKVKTQKGKSQRVK